MEYANGSLKAAVNDWTAKKPAALQKRGTSKVTSMNNLFGAHLFNADLSKWQISNVVHFFNMSSTWDTSKATVMKNIFRNAKAFNSDIGGWTNLICSIFLLEVTNVIKVICCYSFCNLLYMGVQ